MSTKLGRNPFEKKTTAQENTPRSNATTFAASDEPTSSVPSAGRNGLLSKVLIDLPAEAFVVALKARIIVREMMK